MLWHSAGVSADAVDPPSGIVTFLFTDVEGSTRRWEADADAMRAALAAHDRVLRQAIESHGGWLFKHTGDGVCAAFASPRSAVDAAVAAQLAVELPVRMAALVLWSSGLPHSLQNFAVAGDRLPHRPQDSSAIVMPPARLWSTFRIVTQ